MESLTKKICLLFILLVSVSMMAFGVDRVSRFTVPNFTGGLIEQTNPSLLKDTNASALNDIEFKNGIAQTRQGYVAVVQSVNSTTFTVSRSYSVIETDAENPTYNSLYMSSTIVDYVLSATKNGSSIDLSWTTPNASVANYTVYRYVLPRGSSGEIVSSNIVGLQLTVTMSAGVTFNYYRVYGKDSAGKIVAVSNYAYSLLIPLAPNAGSAYWLSMPYSTTYKKASDLTNEYSPASETIRWVAKYNYLTQDYTYRIYGQGSWSGDFDLEAGQAYQLNMQDGAATINLVGSYLATVNHSIAKNTATTSQYWFSLPWFTNYTKASDILSDLNSESFIINKLSFFDYASQTYRLYQYTNRWVGIDFPLIPGEGYLLNIANGDINWTPEISDKIKTHAVFDFDITTINNIINATLTVPLITFVSANIPVSYNASGTLYSASSVLLSTTNVPASVNTLQSVVPQISTISLTVSDALLTAMLSSANYGFMLSPKDTYLDISGNAISIQSASWNISIDTANVTLVVRSSPSDTSSKSSNVISGVGSVTDVEYGNYILGTGTYLPTANVFPSPVFVNTNGHCVVTFNVSSVGSSLLLSAKLRFYVANPGFPPGSVASVRIYKNTTSFVSADGGRPEYDYDDYVTFPMASVGYISVDIPLAWVEYWKTNNYGVSFFNDSGFRFYTTESGLGPILEIEYVPVLANSVKKVFSWVRNDGEEFLFGADDSAIYKLDSNINFQSFYTGLGSFDLTATAYKNRFYFTNNESGMVVTNGDVVRKFNQTPTHTFTVTTYNAGPGAGLLAATYNYTYTFIDQLSEWSTANTVQSIKIASDNEGVIVSLNGGFNTTPITVSSWAVYRTFGQTSTSSAGILSTYFIVENSTTGRVTDNLLDSLLGKRPPNLAPTANIIYSWLGRLWLADDVSHSSLVYVSPASDSTALNDGYWSGNYPLGLANASDVKLIESPGRITGLSDIAGTLVIFKRNEVFVGAGQDPNSSGYIIRKTKAKTGCISHDTIKQSPQGDKLYYLAPDGRVFTYSGFINENDNFLFLGNFVAESPGDLIEGTYKNLHIASLNISVAGVIENKYIVSVPNGTSTVNNLALVYDNIDKNWTKWSINSNGFARYKDEDYFVSSEDGFTYKFTTGLYADAGNAISANIESKWFDMGNPYEPKELSFLDINLESSGDWSLGWELFVDSSPTTNISGNISLSGPSATGIKSKRIWGMRGVNGRFFKLRLFMNQLGKNFKLYNASFGYNVNPQ